MVDQAHSHVSPDDLTSSFDMQTHHCLAPISKIKGNKTKEQSCVCLNMKLLDFKEVTLQNFKKVPSQDRHKKLWHQGIIQLTFHHSQRKDLVVSTLLCNFHKWTCFPLKYHWELQNENHRKAVVITHVPLMNNLETEHQMYKCHAWFKAFIVS